MVTLVRKPTEVRREEIARAALSIIGERGVSALTTTAVAGAIGLTSGALFRHFDSREEMLRGVARYALQRIEATFPDPASPARKRLLELAENRIRVLRADPGLAWLLRSEHAFHAFPADSVAELRRVVEESRRFMLEALRQGVSEGVFRSDIPPEDLLVPVLGTIHVLSGLSGVHRLGSGGPGPNVERALRALERLLAPAPTVGPGPNKPQRKIRKGRS